MTLPNILQPPEGPAGWREFWFNHNMDHIEIVQGIKSLTGIILPIYIIDPWNDNDRDGILERHQQFHTDMNNLLGIPGNDLSDVDFAKPNEILGWVFLNYQEHQSARSILAI